MGTAKILIGSFGVLAILIGGGIGYGRTLPMMEQGSTSPLGDVSPHSPSSQQLPRTGPALPGTTVVAGGAGTSWSGMPDPATWKGTDAELIALIKATGLPPAAQADLLAAYGATSSGATVPEGTGAPSPAPTAEKPVTAGGYTNPEKLYSPLYQDTFLTGMSDWVNAFQEEHEGWGPIEFYGGDGQGGDRDKHAGDKALWDRSWAEQFQAAYGKPPGPYDWEASYIDRQIAQQGASSGWGAPAGGPWQGYSG